MSCMLGKGFRQLGVLKPGYPVPNGQAVSEWSTVANAEVRRNACAVIENSAISFTADIWKSLLQMEACVKVTAHLIITWLEV